MNDRIEYIIRDRSDWQGAAFVYDKFHDAFDAWSENQDCEVIEICIAEGTARDITDDMASLYPRVLRRADELRAEQQFYARAV